ncbi:hypothetical protein [Sporosarcina sp. E16_8]|uniref:hypothetical protein n=1 Tax=Sporosarcina sp. E16_8 TaxID=2789295 RepID=UPI001A9147FB|nr:hypothetical protein [Sporosarcina sp. E16_8]MBO0586624.1 hypothetical protein [Sporosarcina sp. E16_8]
MLVIASTAKYYLMADTVLLVDAYVGICKVKVEEYGFELVNGGIKNTTNYC